MTFTTIRGTGGAADTFAGSNGVDIIAFINQTSPFLLYGAQSNDVVNVVSNYQAAISGTLVGGQGDDNYNLTGGGGAFTGSVQGSEGNDTLALNALGSSSIEGGQGNDTVTTAGTITGASINGNKGLDTITIGGAAAAVGTTAVTNSTIRGGQGVDSITINTGSRLNSSAIYGDEGNDIIVSNLAAVAANTPAAYSSSTVFGGNGDDNITGGAANDVFSGDAGNDVITGAVGADTINGGAGNDRFVLAAGDTFAGLVTLGAAGTNISQAADIYQGANTGDVLVLGGNTLGAPATVAGQATGAAVGAALAAGAGATALIRGTYNGSSFVAGTAAADIDYLVQWTSGAAAADINSIVLDDIGFINSITSTAAGGTTVFTIS